jgi:superfamily II DNA or RNA helicase
MGGFKGNPEIGGGTLISTFSLAYEGLDIPELDTLFLTTPHSDVKQAVGRITRSKGAIKEIWDYVDNWSIFKNMWYKRKKIYDGVEDNCGAVCLFS